MISTNSQFLITFFIQHPISSIFLEERNLVAEVLRQEILEVGSHRTLEVVLLVLEIHPVRLGILQILGEHPFQQDPTQTLAMVHSRAIF